MLSFKFSDSNPADQPANPIPNPSVQPLMELNQIHCGKPRNVNLRIGRLSGYPKKCTIDQIDIANDKEVSKYVQ